MGTLIVSLLLLGAVALSIRSMVRDKKNGKSLQCGCDCSHCGACCQQGQEAHDAPTDGEQLSSSDPVTHPR